MTTDLHPSRAVPEKVRAVPVRTRWLDLAEVRWAAVSLAAFCAALVLQVAGTPGWAWGVAYGLCYVCGGWEPALAGLRALRDRTLDVDLLMIVAALGAAAIGQVTDGGLLIVIFAASGALEALATARTADSVRALLDPAPATATRLGSGGEEETVTAADLRIGDVLLIRPGERVAADGRVLGGTSDVDQASITGESLPAVKRAGDEVFAGTVNGTGALRVRVERDAADTVIARIVTMVRRASLTKASAQLFIEKIEQRYSVGVVVATLAVFAIPLTLGEPPADALLRAMTFMIVASPCAVVLATMPPLLAAMATAGRHGVLVKSAVAMERLGTVTQVAFDKTGTLTEGRPRLAEVRLLPGAPADLTEERLLALAAAAEQPSEHPLGRAVVQAARTAGPAVEPVDGFTSELGRGVRARVGGLLVEVTSPDHLPGDDRHRTGHQMVAGLQRSGYTAVMVRIDGTAAGVLALADRIRPGAVDAVSHLSVLTGSAPVLLTGDNAPAAAQLADRVHIGDVHAGLLPEDKVSAVTELQRRGARVALVGDGVNDAPALAAAHVGIAMGRAGSDLALETADAVITVTSRPPSPPSSRWPGAPAVS
ncbi:heavy metal translocating P-type ATPase [Planomonospora venezuelensis]|uniref:Heavy metal translocating P-type ATPase n=1 Tax=Planomonospora venezuelensis TaxID=1999 RepID=A0A841DLL2_PLAVE|nr:heavy metal translocating P-type ATPase [Planomonospora venezuelensis]MBB5967996.1 heavy metal translocating P-type ATPase [Planomonospora venezuelensis]GIN02464.1 metal-transporting ATPase [Planomonospora venezuelensis]